MDSKQYWNDRYMSGGNSGNGSYGKQLASKLLMLKGLGINTITDIGCGDFNFGTHLLEVYPKAKYHGYDISEVIVEKNKALFPQHTFTTIKDEDFEPADLVLCVDVLLHILDDEEEKRFLDRLEKVWNDPRTRYLAITAYNRDEHMENHVRIRKFDEERFGGFSKIRVKTIAEQDGELWFYIFDKQKEGCPTGVLGDEGTHGIGPITQKLDLSKVTCCLNTKEATYPKEILDHISQFPFGEILIKTHSDSPHWKQELFRKAKHDLIYYQDDDAICPINELVENYQPSVINVAMKKEHFEKYKDMKMTMGLGWGAIFPKSMLESMDKYIAKYGEDALYKREDTRILTWMNYPQNRMVLPIKDLPSAFAEDRLWRQPKHYDYIATVEERCSTL